MEAVFNKHGSCGESHLHRVSATRQRRRRKKETLNNKTAISNLLLEMVTTMLTGPLLYC